MSSKKGSKVLVILNDDKFCLNADSFITKQEISLYSSATLYETVRILTENSPSDSLIAGSFKSLCTEGFHFFTLLNSSPSWKCCCLAAGPLPIHPLLLSLIGRHQLALKQTKEEVMGYISEFLTCDIGTNSLTEPLQPPGCLKDDSGEILLSPEELQALLSA